MSRENLWGIFFCQLALVIVGAKGAILTSKYSRVTQNKRSNSSTSVFENALSTLSAYCGSQGCQIQFGNDLILQKFASDSFNCSGNNDTPCGLKFSEAQEVLKAIVAKRDSIYLSTWLNADIEENTTFLDGKVPETYPRR